jgi:hypothetical protein
MTWPLCGLFLRVSQRRGGSPCGTCSGPAHTSVADTARFAGSELFPETQFHRHHAKTKLVALPKDQCFSLLLNVRGDDDADEVTVALHLEVPPGGNGRSRNEWVSAFNSLMCCKLPIYQQTSNQSEGGSVKD